KAVNKVEFQEKKLYHQIHPLKLLTDWITGVISLYILWSHQIVTALIVLFLPSILVSIIMRIYVSVDKRKNSSFGNYIQGFMTKGVEIVRFIGFAIMILGAWFNLIWLIFCGLIIILAGWFRGIFSKK